MLSIRDDSQGSSGNKSSSNAIGYHKSFAETARWGFLKLSQWTLSSWGISKEFFSKGMREDLKIYQMLRISILPSTNDSKEGQMSPACKIKRNLISLEFIYLKVINLHLLDQQLNHRRVFRADACYHPSRYLPRNMRSCTADDDRIPLRLIQSLPRCMLPGQYQLHPSWHPR